MGLEWLIWLDPILIPRNTLGEQGVGLTSLTASARPRLQPEGHNTAIWEAIGANDVQRAARQGG